MSVKANYDTKISVVETLETAIDGLSSDKKITHDAFNFQKSMDANSTPAVSKVVSFIETLSGATPGIQTIDLYTLTAKGVNGANVSGDGLKVQVFKIKNPVGNSDLTVKFGAATGYLLFGAAWTLILKAGQEFIFYGNAATPTISNSLKHIDLSGGTNDTGIEVLIVMG